MNIDRRINRPCTLVYVTYDTADEYGNPTETVTEVRSRCYLQQRSGTEITELRDTQIGDWFLLLPSGTTIENLTRVRVDGYGAFELNGPAWAVENPRVRRVDHVEARLRQAV